jgi:hypothetical protein
MNSEIRMAVLLKGGLGNQLFQIAAGIYASKSEHLEVFSDFTLPRKTDGIADALFFKWPKSVKENTNKSNKLERKVLALSLSQSLKNNPAFPKNLAHGLVKVLTNLVFALKFKSATNVISGEGVGYCELILKPGQTLLNGYFQAHQYAFDPAVYSQLQEIRLKKESPALVGWIQKAQLENPIIIHLRLGDYKKEAGIGILPAEYYQKALKELEVKEKSKNIWIFTDEVESVERFIQPPFEFKVSIIGENGLNPAETLELMRHGSAYVIANSTFSWWAAFLSYQSGCTKIMPSPWFQNMPSPVGIKPQDWTEIEFLNH